MQWGPVLVGSRVSQFPVSLPVAGLSLAPGLVALAPVVPRDAHGLALAGKRKCSHCPVCKKRD